ncbi:MAG: HEPN domain-containing protein [Ignavibacteria bacterium]
MDEFKTILINNCINKSREAVEDAEFNFNNERISTALNRIYYSVFYSVLALAYKDDFITSKHLQLKGWFNKKYIYMKRNALRRKC